MGRPQARKEGGSGAQVREEKRVGARAERGAGTRMQRRDSVGRISAVVGSWYATDGVKKEGLERWCARCRLPRQPAGGLGGRGVGCGMNCSHLAPSSMGCVAAVGIHKWWLLAWRNGNGPSPGLEHLRPLGGCGAAASGGAALLAQARQLAGTVCA